jgi:hypothetical protein
LVSIYRVYLLKLAIIVNTEGQVFNQVGKSRQLVLVVTILITYSTDRWNLIDIVMLMKHIMTERIIIDKFYKVFKI